MAEYTSAVLNEALLNGVALDADEPIRFEAAVSLVINGVAQGNGKFFTAAIASSITVAGLQNAARIFGPALPLTINAVGAASGQRLSATGNLVINGVLASSTNELEATLSLVINAGLGVPAAALDPLDALLEITTGNPILGFEPVDVIRASVIADAVIARAQASAAVASVQAAVVGGVAAKKAEALVARVS